MAWCHSLFDPNTCLQIVSSSPKPLLTAVPLCSPHILIRRYTCSRVHHLFWASLKLKSSAGLYTACKTPFSILHAGQDRCKANWPRGYRHKRQLSSASMSWQLGLQTFHPQVLISRRHLPLSRKEPLCRSLLLQNHFQMGNWGHKRRL